MRGNASTVRQHLHTSLKSRAKRVRLEAIFATQSGVAAGLSWFLATDVLGHAHPFFAPVAAIIVLGAAAGLRWRRAIEVAGGVALGIAVGDSLIILIGVGPVQIAAVVALAIIAMAFLGGGTVAVGQAGASAVLVATLAPPTTGIFFDAVVGGVTALVVMSLLLPLNPLTRVKRATDRALSVLAEVLTQASRAVDEAEPELAESALSTLRERDRDREALREALLVGRETATLSPLRWGSRAVLSRYTKAAVHIDRATRNVRVIESQVSTLIRAREPAPHDLAVSIGLLAEGATSLRRGLVNGRDPRQSRTLVLDAVRTAGIAYSVGVGLSGSAVVAQLESTATELLSASGLAHRAASARVRRTSASARR